MRSLTESLVRDGRDLLDHLGAFERALEAGDLLAVRAFLVRLSRSWPVHRHDEDDVLLPVLLKHLEPERPAARPRSGAPPAPDHWTAVQAEIRTEAEKLHTDHQRLASCAARLLATVDADPATLADPDLRGEAHRLAQSLRDHLTAEIDHLYPVVEQLLTDGEKLALRPRMGHGKRQ